MYVRGRLTYFGLVNILMSYKKMEVFTYDKRVVENGGLLYSSLGEREGNGRRGGKVWLVIVGEGSQSRRNEPILSPDG
jgi:hypothetical protein